MLKIVVLGYMNKSGEISFAFLCKLRGQSKYKCLSVHRSVLTWPYSKLLVVKHSYLWQLWSLWQLISNTTAMLMLFSVTHDSSFMSWSLFSPLQEYNKETFPVLLCFMSNMTDVSIPLCISACSPLLCVTFSFICNFLSLAIAYNAYQMG